jgi:hypothetical protein
MELRLIIAMFVWHFDVELENGQLELYYKDAFVARRGSLRVRVIVTFKSLYTSGQFEISKIQHCQGSAHVMLHGFI